ncbi:MULTISPECIES: aldo/keto reductase [Enterococcus]|uniref:aldo/keto reductase n=1 Tax=Enterococcus TaxID=1350 RepID=UPI00065F805D|nr:MULTISPECIES: aldo/keto reductase [Enterococcus]EGO2824381.1 aldo/keto reductase family oxidoreductase [Enterococcus faecalis]EGO7550956.1 aldo/keto reductase family oxidoreductase [Enterococcus faecalis]EGO8326400.1 aldo/keto reductase family oxidoreductase [Enterococcus faecalis]EGO9396616.1 aldo/keto reductase family oxidoreductase [Enterococcus faecalis]EGS7939804.1 aldo/keto reductase family oxidoreductase [Enterococcus faecalis]
MKQLQFGTSDETVSSVILGCMRLNSAENPQQVIETAYDHGITFFDHADIYGGGDCETIFGKSLKESTIRREDIFIQTKCGIRQGFFDFSKAHILEAVEGSLQRLGVDSVDALLLHRPDTLVEPEEVAEAFHLLEKQGKVRYFGVSNQTPGQIELLKTAVKQPLLANQLQFGIKHTGMVDQGLQTNMEISGSIDYDHGILDYSRLKQMTIQAWSPYQYGYFEGVFIGNEKFPELNQKLSELAEKYQTTPTGLASSWILRHPANMQVIAGSMNLGRIEEIAKAADIVISREDWYDIYRAAGNVLP